MTSLSRRLRSALLVATIVVPVAALGGCGKSESASSSVATPSGTPAPSGLFADRSISEGAVLAGIGEVKKSAQAGETVKFVARVGGRAACFVPGSAVFIVADPVLEDCIQKGDGCPKPWDYCCEPKERIRANTATVRLVDATGAPLAGSAEGLGGLAPLLTIEVLGTVSESGPDGLFVVDATQVFVRPG
jgi:hypothetical protein